MLLWLLVVVQILLQDNLVLEPLVDQCLLPNTTVLDLLGI